MKCLIHPPLIFNSSSDGICISLPIFEHKCRHHSWNKRTIIFWFKECHKLVVWGDFICRLALFLRIISILINSVYISFVPLLKCFLIKGFWSTERSRASKMSFFPLACSHLIISSGYSGQADVVLCVQKITLCVLKYGILTISWQKSWNKIKNKIKKNKQAKMCEIHCFWE